MLSKALETGVCFHSAPLLGTWRDALFLGPLRKGKRNLLFSRIIKIPLNKIPPPLLFSLSIGALLGNLEGVHLPGFSERKEKVYLGSFLGPRGH